MTNNPHSPQAVTDLLARLLDKGYTDATAQVMSAIVRNSTTGVLNERLTQFEAEAKRLSDLQPMTADNPVFRALYADFETVMQKNATLVEAVAPDVQDSAANAAAQATRAFTFPGVSDAQLSQIGVPWRRVDPEAVRRLIDFASKPEFQALLDNYQRGAGNVVYEAFIRGIASGRGPLATARDVRDIAEGLPVSQANAIVRTLQLSSYRAASAANYAANSDILEPEGVRIAALDDRCCMTCVELHGTRVPIDEPIESHWNCRCTVIAVVKGREIDVETGEDWFNGRTPDEQRAQMGDAAYAAWQDGAIDLPDFVKHTSDPVFGPMVHEDSLVGMLGDKAKDYYGKR